MTVGTLLYTWLNGRQVGTDEFGNRYFEQRRPPATGRRPRRWVLYRGLAEASKVPPEWHGWLHHIQPAPPHDGDRPRFAWQRDHLPNLTGTPYAYRPPGHVLEGGRRAAATGDYESWTPD